MKNILPYIIALALLITTISINARDCDDMKSNCIEDIINNYILKTKSWTPDEYRIEFNGSEDNTLIFHVILISEELEFKENLEKFSNGEGTIELGGGGNSIALYFDCNTRSVLKELHFQ